MNTPAVLLTLEGRFETNKELNRDKTKKQGIEGDMVAAVSVGGDITPSFSNNPT